MPEKRLFQTCQEQIEPLELEVTGNVPEWLQGNYFLNGPGLFDQGNFSFNHLFDGCAMIVKFSIGKKIELQSRFVQSLAYKKLNSHGRNIFQEFGTPGTTDSDRNAIGRLLSKFVPLDLTDNVCANVHAIGKELYACTETNHIWHIDQDTLETKEKIDITKIVGINVCSSHPHITKDGTIYNVGSSFGTSVKYHIIKIDPPSTSDDSSSVERKGYRKGSILFTIPSRWSTKYGYYHSFGMTENYFILLEQCFTANIPKLIVSQAKGRAIRDCLEWTPDQQNRFIIMDRKSGKVLKTKYMSESIFMLHHVNAFEVDDKIVVDVVANNSPEILDKLYLDQIRDNFCFKPDSSIQRFVIPVDVKKGGSSRENIAEVDFCDASAVLMEDNKVWLTPEKLTDNGFGVPCLNYEGNNTKKYNYVFGNSEIGYKIEEPTLMKLNVDTKDQLVWKGPKNHFFLEPKFVRDPNGESNDSGILISLGLSSMNSRHLLVFLDAVTMKEVARAAIPLNVDVPFCFHGCFIPKN